MSYTPEPDSVGSTKERHPDNAKAASAISVAHPCFVVLPTPQP